MAEDIIVHVRISEKSNKRLYDEMKNQQTKRAKRLVQLAMNGLDAESTEGAPQTQEISEIKQDLLLLKQNVLALQNKLEGKNFGQESAFASQPIAQVQKPSVIQPVSQEETNIDTIEISEDTNQPISSDAMDSLRSLLNG